MKTERITVRFSKEEIEEITRNANKFGYNSSEYVRVCVKSAIKEQYIPAGEVKKVFHKLWVNSEFMKIKNLAKLIREVSVKWMLL